MDEKVGLYVLGVEGFISANVALGYAIGHHMGVRRGYLLGSKPRFGCASRLGIRITQQGAVIDLQGSGRPRLWGSDATKVIYDGKGVGGL